MFSYKAKNYALLTRDGEVIIKGGALKSRGLEKFQRVFLEEMIKLLMEGKPEAIQRSARTTSSARSANAKWPIEMLMKTDTLQDSLEKYRAKDRRLRPQPRRRLRARAGQWPRLQTRRANQLLHQRHAEEGRRLRSREARLSDFDPQNRDENVDYYVAKLDELVKKFANVTPGPKQEALLL